MKKRFIVISIFMLCVFVTDMNAKIWNVDNNAVSSGDFTTLQDAQNSASPGDTIFVYPSATTYAGPIFTKQLHLFGVGFDLDIFGGQATNTTSKIADITFYGGSEGSELQGFDGNFYVGVHTNNITIKKNNLNRIDIEGSSCIVMQNKIICGNQYDRCIHITAPNIGEILIANNKIYNSGAGGGNGVAIEGNTSSVISVINNVINVIESGDYALVNLGTNSLVQNNIIMNGVCFPLPVYRYNLSNSDQLPQSDGNIINVDMNTVFEDPANFTTGWHLIAGSPAIEHGFSGVDMGIYGGDSPYVDGGYPGLPAIFYLDSEGITTPQNGLDVVIKAKSNRE